MPRTIGEKQTPIHYAAKYNAVSSLKVLIDNRVDYNDRDYKSRTPIFLAAEMGKLLLSRGKYHSLWQWCAYYVLGTLDQKLCHVHWKNILKNWKNKTKLLLKRMTFLYGLIQI